MSSTTPRGWTCAGGTRRDPAMIGRRLDIGTPAGYLRSILEYAALDLELAAEIEPFRADSQ